MFCGSDFICDFPVLESLSDEFDDSLLSFAGNTFSVALASEHSCLRYRRVASFTRLIPPLIPNRKKRRLKCAFTVRRAILSCRAISEFSQPCNSSSTICCSRGPSRINLSFTRNPPKRITLANQAILPTGGSRKGVPLRGREGPTTNGFSNNS